MFRKDQRCSQVLTKTEPSRASCSLGGRPYPNRVERKEKESSVVNQASSFSLPSLLNLTSLLIDAKLLCLEASSLTLFGLSSTRRKNSCKFSIFRMCDSRFSHHSPGRNTSFAAPQPTLQNHFSSSSLPLLSHPFSPPTNSLLSFSVFLNFSNPSLNSFLTSFERTKYSVSKAS